MISILKRLNKIAKQKKSFEIKYEEQYLCVGDNVSFYGNCRFGLYNTIYDNVTLQDVVLGDFTYIGDFSSILKTAFGKFCCVGPRVVCGLGQHPTHTYVSSHPIFYSTLKQAQVTFADKDYFEEFDEIAIGNDVWLGANVTVLSGVNISDGAVIAAGSVVNNNIPPYAIAGGVPAKVIKYRFTEQEVEFLRKFKWWNRDIAWVKNNYKKFHNIKEFVSEYGG